MVVVLACFGIDLYLIEHVICKFLDNLLDIDGLDLKCLVPISEFEDGWLDHMFASEVGDDVSSDQTVEFVYLFGCFAFHIFFLVITFSFADCDFG